MFRESATGRISAGATPASASAARYAEAPPWPTEAYMNAATSMPAASRATTSGSMVRYIPRNITKLSSGSPQQLLERGQVLFDRLRGLALHGPEAPGDLSAKGRDPRPAATLAPGRGRDHRLAKRA